MKAPVLIAGVALLVGGCIELQPQWTPPPAASAPAVASPTPPAGYAQPSPAPVAPPPAYVEPAPPPPPLAPVFVEPPPPPPMVTVVTDRDIVRLYEELLGRPPSRDEVREWRHRSHEVPIGADQIVESLRHTDEYRRRAVRRAYRDLLERDPDRPGFERYVRMMEQGASEADICGRIRQSEEYRVTLPDSKTRRAYREVLGREADEGGLQHYRKLIVDKGWTEEDVEKDLRRSAEFRNRRH